MYILHASNLEYTYVVLLMHMYIRYKGTVTGKIIPTSKWKFLLPEIDWSGPNIYSLKTLTSYDLVSAKC